jgi:hypothetical protein
MDTNYESGRRLWRAVLVQAFKDFCSNDNQSVGSVVRWINSPDFEYVIHMAGHEETQVRDAFERLSKFSPEMRKELIGEMIHRIMSIRRK